MVYHYHDRPLLNPKAVILLSSGEATMLVTSLYIITGTFLVPNLISLYIDCVLHLLIV